MRLRVSIYTYILTMIAMVVTLISCDDNDDSPSEEFITNLATVNLSENDPTKFYLTLDNQTTLYPKNAVSNFKPKQNQRAFVNYVILKEQTNSYHQTIRINSISNIFTTDIRIENNADSIQLLGNDPVDVMSIWLGDDYLNLRFTINIGGEQKFHTLNLLYNPEDNTSADIVKLQLKHNAFGDIPRFGERSYATFNLRKLGDILNDNTVFIVETIDFNNKPKSYTLRYR